MEINILFILYACVRVSELLYILLFIIRII